MNYCKVWNRIRNKVREKTNFIFYKKRLKKLTNTDFTIISNNCWGGKVYRYFQIPYKTPTIGLYFYQEDYIKFIKNLKYYINLELNFIKVDESKYKKELMEKFEVDVPIGILDDIEIIFLHYKTEKEAYEKWNRRCKRINWNNLIIKNSQMNKTEESHLIEFKKIKGIKKIMFVSDVNYVKDKHFICKYKEKKDEVNDTERWDDEINIYKIINTDYYM